MAFITVNRALTLIEKGFSQIQHATSTGVFIASVTPIRPISADFKTNDELKARIQSDTDKVEAAFDKFMKLKEAVAESNLKTKVMFQGKETTIVGILAQKLLLQERKNYLSCLKMQARKVNSDVEKGKQSIEAQISSLESDAKVAMFKELSKTQEVTALTAGNKSPAEIIKTMEDEINFLENELDMVLSDSNLATKIEVDFEI